jgi:hypothetical protein
LSARLRITSGAFERRELMRLSRFLPVRATGAAILALFACLASPTPVCAQSFAAFEGVLVANAAPTDVARLADAGVLTLRSPGVIYVTIAGEMKARAEQTGAVGVLLLPDLPYFDALYRTRRVLLATSEVSAPVAAGESSYFVAPSRRVEAGFSKYRVLLYNTTGAVVAANVYVGAARN